jgi:hypothetical protein
MYLPVRRAASGRGRSSDGLPEAARRRSPPHDTKSGAILRAVERVPGEPSPLDQEREYISAVYRQSGSIEIGSAVSAHPWRRSVGRDHLANRLSPDGRVRNESRLGEASRSAECPNATVRVRGRRRYRHTRALLPKDSCRRRNRCGLKTRTWLAGCTRVPPAQRSLRRFCPAATRAYSRARSGHRSLPRPPRSL